MSFVPGGVGVAFNSTTSGTADFIAGTAPSGYFAPESAGVVDGKAYNYRAIDQTGLVYEDGRGTYTKSSHTLARTTVNSTSNNDQNKITFLTTPTVYVYPSPSTTLENGQFLPGTTTVFWQSTAPTGWTRNTSFNDYALRIVSSGGGTSGGSNAFSTVFTQTVTGSHTPSLADMVDHTHPYTEPDSPVIEAPVSCQTLTLVPGITSTNTGGMGGGSAAHNHAIVMNITYLDFMLASKN